MRYIVSLQHHPLQICGDWLHGTQYLLIKSVSCHLEKGVLYNICKHGGEEQCKVFNVKNKKKQSMDAGYSALRYSV